MLPDLDDLAPNEWKEYDNLDAESLQRICFEVLSSLNITKRILPADQNFTYIRVPRKRRVHDERVLTYAPVKFHHIM